MTKIYLACPYTHPDRKVREARFRTASRKAGELMVKGHIVFSPLSHSVPIEEYCGWRESGEFWMKQDLSILLDWADCLWVLKCSGWVDSTGVSREIEEACLAGLPVRFIDP